MSLESLLRIFIALLHLDARIEIVSAFNSPDQRR